MMRLVYGVLVSVVAFRLGPGLLAQDPGTTPTFEPRLTVTAAPGLKGDRGVVFVEGSATLPDRSIVVGTLYRKVLSLKGEELRKVTSLKALVKDGAFATEFTKLGDEPLLGLFQVTVLFDPLGNQYPEVKEALVGLQTSVEATAGFCAGSISEAMEVAKSETGEVQKYYSECIAAIDAFATIVDEPRNGPVRREWAGKRERFIANLERIQFRYVRAQKGRFYVQSFAILFTVSKELQFAEFHLTEMGGAGKGYSGPGKPPDVDSLRKLMENAKKTIAAEFFLVLVTLCEDIHEQVRTAFEYRAQGYVDAAGWKALEKFNETVRSACDTWRTLVTHPDIRPLVDEDWKSCAEALGGLQRPMGKYFELRSVKELPHAKMVEIESAEGEWSTALAQLRKTLQE